MLHVDELVRILSMNAETWWPLSTEAVLCALSQRMRRYNGFYTYLFRLPMIFPQIYSCEVTKRKKREEFEEQTKKALYCYCLEWTKFGYSRKKTSISQTKADLLTEIFPHKITFKKLVYYTHTRAHWSHVSNTFKRPATFAGSQDQTLPMLPLPLQLSGVDRGKLPRLGLDSGSLQCRKSCKNSNKISFSQDNYQMKFSTLLIFIKLTLLYESGITFIFFRAGLPSTPTLALAGWWWYSGIIKNGYFRHHPRELILPNPILHRTIIVCHSRRHVINYKRKYKSLLIYSGG